MNARSRLLRSLPESLLFLAVLLAVAPISQAAIVITSISRHVSAAATGAPGDGDASIATGVFDNEAHALGGSPAGTIGSDSDQFSVTPLSVGQVMNGAGNASTFASATGFTGFSNSAQSFFDVFFTVDVSGFYGLDAGVEWDLASDTPPYTGVASVKLIDFTNTIDIVELKRDVGTPGPGTLSDAYFLVTGPTYRLTANAQIGGGFATAGDYAAEAAWEFILAPEPSSLVLAMFAALALGIAGTRTRRPRN